LKQAVAVCVLLVSKDLKLGESEANAIKPELPRISRALPES